MTTIKMRNETLPNIYTILTEDKNIDKVQKVLDKWFNGYNISKVSGRYQGKNEKALNIEIIGQDEGAVKLACNEIKKINEQDQVWYKKQVRQQVFIV
ncbi:MAG: hypothetical protein ACOC5T_03475 [Elusimicrobiota bacterium]